MKPAKHQRQSFQAVVDDLKAASASRPAPSPTPGLRDGTLTADDGRTFTEVDDDLTPSRALDLARGGASVVWDSCGCGGDCGVEWVSRDDVTAMVRAGEPLIRRKTIENIAELQAADGSIVLLVSGDVRWGDRLG